FSTRDRKVHPIAARADEILPIPQRRPSQGNEVTLRREVQSRWNSRRRHRVVKHVTNCFGGEIAREFYFDRFRRVWFWQLHFNRCFDQLIEDRLRFGFNIRKRCVASLICGTCREHALKRSLHHHGKITRHVLVGWSNTLQNRGADTLWVSLEISQRRTRPVGTTEKVS